MNPRSNTEGFGHDEPASRARLFPEIKAHLAKLISTFDLLDETRRETGAQLAEWIVEGFVNGKPMPVIVVCTGNSRRSMFGATLGNIAAAYWGMPNVRFFSGGTAPSAFNERTIVALRAIGVEIAPMGQEAPRGESGTANPLYRVCWGRAGDPPFELRECSKRFDDPSLPDSGFAAVLVCSEADAECPTVRGASVRITMPFSDPKEADGSAVEARTYAERRDEIGRVLLWTLREAKARFALKSVP